MLWDDVLFELYLTLKFLFFQFMNFFFFKVGLSLRHSLWLFLILWLKNSSDLWKWDSVERLWTSNILPDADGSLSDLSLEKQLNSDNADKLKANRTKNKVDCGRLKNDSNL